MTFDKYKFVNNLYSIRVNWGLVSVYKFYKSENHDRRK